MTDDYADLEAALPGFSRARGLVKAHGDRIEPLGFAGTKFDFYRFVSGNHGETQHQRPS